MGTPRAARCVGGQPARSDHSRVRWAWSAYPHSCATSASGLRPSTRAGGLEPRHPLVLLRRQPALLAHQRARGAAGCSRPRRPPRRPPRRGSGRPAPGPPRRAARRRRGAPAPRSAPAPPRPGPPRGRARASRSGRSAQVRRDVVELEQLAGQLAGRDAEQRPRARRWSAPSWMPLWVPSWWISAGAACSPDTVDHRFPRSRPSPHPTSSGSPTGSTKVRLVVGSPRCTPGAPRSTSYATSEATYGAQRSPARPPCSRPERRSSGSVAIGSAYDASRERHSRGLRARVRVQQDAELVEGEVAELAGLELAELAPGRSGCGSAGGPGGRRGRAAGGRSGCGPRG